MSELKNPPMSLAVCVKDKEANIKRVCKNLFKKLYTDKRNLCVPQVKGVRIGVVIDSKNPEKSFEYIDIYVYSLNFYEHLPQLQRILKSISKKEPVNYELLFVSTALMLNKITKSRYLLQICITEKKKD